MNEAMPDDSDENTDLTFKKREHYRELAKIALDHFFNRRELEWRLSFAFWTAISAFTGVFLLKDFKLDKVADSFLSYLGWAYVGFFFLSMGWQYLIQIGHAGDKALLWYRLDMAELNAAEIRLTKHQGKRPDVETICLSGRNILWAFAHLVVSAIFLIGSFLLIKMALDSCPVRNALKPNPSHSAQFNIAVRK